MPWNEVKPLDERIRFIADFLNNFFSVTELCHHYNISRTTGYKWIERYEKDGPEALCDRSRKPLLSPNKTPDYIVKELLELRSKHPSWGPKKLLWRIRKDHPDWKLPSNSTTSLILKKKWLCQEKTS